MGGGSRWSWLRRHWVLSGLMILGLGWAGWTLQEPRYRGHGVHFWLRELIIHDREETAEAAQAIAAIGPRAVPAVVTALRARDSRFEKWYLGQLEHLPPSLVQWIPANISAENWHKAGFRASVALGTNALAALPDVLEIITRREIEEWPEYLEILPDLAPREAERVVPVLRAILQDQSLGSSRKHIVSTALYVLAAYGLEALPALTDITTAAKDPELIVQNAAIVALGEIGPAAQDALPLIRARLQSSSSLIRREAAEAIWRITGDHRALAAEILDEFCETYPFTPPIRLEVYRGFGPDAEALRCALQLVPPELLSLANPGSCIVFPEYVGGHEVFLRIEPDRLQERFHPTDATLEHVRQVLDATIAASREQPPTAPR